MRANDYYRLGDPLNNAFKNWDPVLLKITETNPSFFTHFTEELANKLAFEPGNVSSTNAYAEALYLWLNHLSTSPPWAIHQPYFSHSYVNTACEQSSTHWTKMLSKDLKKEGDFKAKPNPLDVSSKKKALSKNSTDVEANTTRKLRACGWEPLEKWDSRPLGISSIN